MSSAPCLWKIRILYEGWLISNAHSEISRKGDHVYKQKKVGSKVQYFSYKLTYLFFDIVALSFNTFFPTYNKFTHVIYSFLGNSPASEF